MGVMQVAAMPQDILPVMPAQAKTGEMGASEAGGFKKLLQERQLSAEAAPGHAGNRASSSPRLVTARPPGKGLEKGRQRVSRKEAQEKDDVEAREDGSKVRNSRTGEALSEDHLPQLNGSEKAAEAAADNVQEVAEPTTSVAGNAVAIVADATPKETVANVVPEQMLDDSGAGEAATVAVGSAGIDSDTGSLLDPGVGAAGTAIIAKDEAASVAITGGANAAEKSGATAVKSAVTVTGKPAQPAHPDEGNIGAATEGRSNTGTEALSRQRDLPHLEKLTVEGAAGTDEASARLEAAAGLAAVKPNVTDAAAKQNQSEEALVDQASQAGQLAPGQQVQGQKAKDVAATPVPEGASPAADVQKEPAGVQEKDSSANVEPKEARLEGEHRRHPAAQAVEQGPPKPVTDIGTASAGKTSSVAEVQGATPQAKLGQEGAGNPAGRGGEEQQQAKQGGEVLPPPFGGELRAPETAAGGYKNEAERTALHENILSQVKDGAVSHDFKGNGQMSIRLNPADLGELKIQVRMEDGRVRIDVQADNRTVKDLLMSNLDTLKEALAGKNFTMEGFEVSTGGGFNNAHPEQRANRQQHSVRRVIGSGYPEADGSEGRVNYLTTDVNNLLDVRF